jgi:hypothetical protein
MGRPHIVFDLQGTSSLGADIVFIVIGLAVGGALVPELAGIAQKTCEIDIQPAVENARFPNRV